MENKAQNRRDWVKNIAIIFLVILLLLTFFSRTIMNARLPEVSAQYAQYATLSSAVKASGTVKANESYNVIFEEEEKVEQTRKVQSVYVKAGDTVEKDAPILALSNDPSEQLKQAREDLAKAEEDLVKLKESGNVDGMTSDKTLIDAQRKIDKAEDKLKELEAEYKSVLAGGDPATVIKDAVKSLNEQIKGIEANIKDVQKQIKEIEKKNADLNTKISEVSGKLASAEALIEEDILSQESVWQKLTAAESALTEAQHTYDNAQASYDALKAEENSWQEMVDRIGGAIGDVEKANTLTNQIKELENSLENSYLELQRYEEDYASQLGDLEKTRDQTIADAAKADKSQTGAAEIEETYSKAVNAAWDDYVKQTDTLQTNHIRSTEDAVYQLKQITDELNDMLGSTTALRKVYDYIEKNQINDLYVFRSEEYSNLVDEVRTIGSDDDRSIAENHCETIYTSVVQLIRNEEDYYDMLSEYASARDRAISSAEEARTQSYKTVVDSAVSSSESYAKAEEAAWETYYNAADTLRRTHDRYVEDMDVKIKDTEKKIEDAKSKLYVIDMPEVDDVIQYEFDYDLGDAKDKLEKAKTAASEAEEAMKKAETDLTAAKDKVASLKKQTLAEGTASGYRAELTGLKASLEANNNAIDRCNDTIDGYNERIEALREKITEKNEELADVPKKRDPDEVKKEIEEQKETIEDLKETFKITEGTEDNTKAERERGIEKAEKEVKDLKEKVKLYEGLGDSKNVTAPIAGRIVSVNFVPGDTVTSGATVASIEIADKGYIVELSMSAEEARRIQVGSPVTVTNSWWYSNISASIAQVKSDPKSQGKNRIIVMDVTGDVSEGQSLNFSIGDRSQSYDSVLPNSAIREDNEGKFVLTVESKKTPLGVRYTARRSAVEIIASDDTQSAVSGLYGSEFVITSSTVPIADGQQVRLAGD